MEVVVFGQNDLDLCLPVHSLGFLSNQRKIALVYSAVDVFVFPSREDNAPLTVGESLLCGTPVVSFPVGNVTDIVKHKSTGYIANYLDCDDMADGIAWALNDSPHSVKFKLLRYFNHYRKSVAIYHSPKLSAKRHIQLYNSIIR